MSYFNKTFLMGRLVRNAESKTTSNGLFIANFSIATNLSKKNEDGKWEDIAHYFNFTLYGNRAKALLPYLIQGQMVAIEGHQIQRRWEKDGKKFSRQETAIDDIKLISKPKNVESSGKEVPGELETAEPVVPPLNSSAFIEEQNQGEFSEPEFTGDVF